MNVLGLKSHANAHKYSHGIPVNKSRCGVYSSEPYKRVISSPPAKSSVQREGGEAVTAIADNLMPCARTLGAPSDSFNDLLLCLCRSLVAQAQAPNEVAPDVVDPRAPRAQHHAGHHRTFVVI